MEKSGAEKLICRTKSPCPVCKGRLDADIMDEGGVARMKKSCPDHGEFDIIVSKDAAFYRKVRSLISPPPGVPERTDNFSDFGSLRGVCLDLTQHCNLNCANCFAQANQSMKPDMTFDQVKEAVDSIEGRPPVIFIQGGEPTLHQELPRIIRYLVSKGCVPKLITNGIKLTDQSYTRKLKEAGLDWVFLQFDGFDDKTYQAFRGRALLDIKMKALENMQAAGFSILLAVMIERDHNLGDVGKIIDFAFEHPNVRQISFLPGSRIGRNELTRDSTRTEPLDVIDAMADYTKGGVGRSDFLSFFRIAKTLNSITGNPDYKPKSCFYPMVLYRENGRVFGMNRVLSPTFAITHPGAMSSAWRMAVNVARLDNSPKDKRTLWICIEHFRELATLDIDDARHCNKVFLDEKGRYVQCCIYNNLYRGVAE